MPYQCAGVERGVWLTAPSTVGMWGTSTLPAPRPAAELFDAPETANR